jgi:hypothetical protein
VPSGVTGTLTSAGTVHRFTVTEDGVLFGVDQDGVGAARGNVVTPGGQGDGIEEPGPVEIARLASTVGTESRIEIVPDDTVDEVYRSATLRCEPSENVSLMLSPAIVVDVVNRRAVRRDGSGHVGAEATSARPSTADRRARSRAGTRERA